MKVVGFIQGKLINKVEFLSDSWIIYYESGDKEDEVRAANFVNFGKFFSLDSGDEIKISNLLNFELVNEGNISIFDSKDKITDFDLAVQYKLFQTILNSNSDDNVSLKN